MNIYIVSVYNCGDWWINTRTHGAVLAELRRKNIPYKELKGESKGRPKESILLFDENIAKQIAKDFNQECYLFSTSNRFTSLKSLSGKVLCRLGKLKLVSKEKALNQLNWFKVDNQYYTVE